MRVLTCLFTALLLTLAACSPRVENESPAAGVVSRTSRVCDADNGGITLAPGFCALVFADSLGRVRHIAAASNGDLYVAIANQQARTGGIVALRDTTGDGKADVVARFGDNGGTGIALHGGSLYFATDAAVLRYPLTAGELQPSSPPDTIVAGLPSDRNHRAKEIAFGADGALYVNIGSPTNSCQVADRQTGSPGQDPCPDLETRAGIWRFDATRKGQTQASGTRYATGLRNVVALAFDPTGQTLYGAQHGRDQLFQNWPGSYTQEQSAEQPSEEFFRINQGADFGWPYCYHDNTLSMKVLAPEYGGDGRAQGRCADKGAPIMAFPGHWAPNGLLFYSGSAFPARYRGGAFIAFHGSWNRAPLPQAGYKVVFVPFANGNPAGNYEMFADDFKGADSIAAPNQARYRPMGLAQARDGSLYISDTEKGRVWRIMWRS
ncbi:MAG: PQQ-dependent sugar dehydrogenase [Gemmatimonadota bacterium]|nr:PQQ-dependent sugar dehydrogenase [Gemmatimonadota bacterium]